MASLQARHARTCKLGRDWTTFDDAEECGCHPSYFVVVREGRSVRRKRIGKNRQIAQRELTAIQAEIDKGESPEFKNRRFEDFATEWLSSLELKPSTIKSYQGTLRLAGREFQGRKLRSIHSSDVLIFLTGLRASGISDSTRNRHMRNLSAFLSAGVRRGYLARNPVKELATSERPQRNKAEAACFVNGELAAIFQQIEDQAEKALFSVLLKTGIRLGEASALTWGDVRLAEGELEVARTYTDGALGEPKSETSKRTIDLTADVVQTLADQWTYLEHPADSTLVFPGGTKDGFQNPKTLRTHLYAAMDRAGISREGESGTLRTIHSFRHTFARRAIETGRPLFWLSRALGHSSLAVTTNIYGHWSRAESKREAEQMQGVFGI